jgi:hypothetical protein
MLQGAARNYGLITLLKEIDITKISFWKPL